MDNLIIIGFIFVILGIFGSIIPVLPGPIFGYIGLVFLYFAKPEEVTFWPLVIFGISMAILVILDYVAPILGAKFSGASNKGLIGCITGSIVGIIFFPPFGIFVGAIIGAILGELAGGKEFKNALKAGIGTIFGSISMIILQTAFSLVLAAYFIWKLFA